MGRIVELSGPSFDAFMYGDNSHLIGDYIQHQLQAIPQAYGGFADRMKDRLVQSYNFVTDAANRLRIQSELYENQLNIVDNHIQSLTTFDQLQQANYTMQRWVMSHPEVRSYYLNQDLDGYSDTYSDDYLGTGVGDDDYNYRRVMDGVMQDEDDCQVIKRYYEDLLPNDEELTWLDKVRILDTYDAIDWMLEICDLDFTVNSDDPPKINRRRNRGK